MKKLVVTGMFVFLALGAFSQNPIGLDPATMMQYVGKISKEQFETIVGEPYSTGVKKEGFNYTKYNVSDKDYTESTRMVQIYCLYLGKDTLLVNLYYRIYHPDSMEIKFKQMPNYKEGDFVYTTALHGYHREEVVVEKKYWVDKFVMTINRYEPRNGVPFGLVNYYIEP